MPHARSADVFATTSLCRSQGTHHRGDECLAAGRTVVFQSTQRARAGLFDRRPSPRSLDDGIERAARILNEARYPIVFGLCDTTSAAPTRGRVDRATGLVPALTRYSDYHGATALAFRRWAKSRALGEVKNRGDLIIFWGCNPVESHPRHLSRYSLEPAGQFVPRGREDRYCVVVDESETATALVADQFIVDQAGQGLRGNLGFAASGQGSRARRRLGRSRDGRLAFDLAGIDGSNEAGQVRRDLLRVQASRRRSIRINIPTRSSPWSAT